MYLRKTKLENEFNYNFGHFAKKASSHSALVKLTTETYTVNQMEALIDA